MTETPSTTRVHSHAPKLRAGPQRKHGLRGAVAMCCSLALSSVAIANAETRRFEPAQGLPAPAKENASWAVLRKAIQSRDYAVRLLATQALGGIRTVDVTGWIEHSLADPEHDVRVAAIDALDRVHSRKALTLLRSVRDDESEALDIRALAASALINHPDE